jgi:hypothetical protein
MPVISAAERATLAAIANDSRNGDVDRGMLEKFARLDLIEPCGPGLCVSVRGQGILGRAAK